MCSLFIRNPCFCCVCWVKRGHFLANYFCKTIPILLLSLLYCQAYSAGLPCPAHPIQKPLCLFKVLFSVYSVLLLHSFILVRTEHLILKRSWNVSSRPFIIIKFSNATASTKNCKFISNLKHLPPIPASRIWSVILQTFHLQICLHVKIASKQSKWPALIVFLVWVTYNYFPL